MRSVLLVAASLSACAIVPQHRIELADAGRVIVSYYDDAWSHTRSQDAQIMANQHCGQYGKTASLERSQVRQSDYKTEALFRCR